MPDYINSLKELPKGIKLFAVQFLSFPFWYISLYLFNNDFFRANTFITIVMFCLCLIATSSIPVMNEMHKCLEYSYTKERIKKITEKYFFSLGVAIFQGLISSILIFTFYTLRKFYAINLDYYAYLVSFYLITFIYYIYLMIANKKLRERILTRQASILSKNLGFADEEEE